MEQVKDFISLAGAWLLGVLDLIGRQTEKINNVLKAIQHYSWIREWAIIGGWAAMVGRSLLRVSNDLENLENQGILWNLEKSGKNQGIL